MIALIIGANGQDGYYLRELLQENKIDTVGISRSGGFLNINLTDPLEVSSLLKTKMPDYIFHLAANSTTRYDVWRENHDTISTGTLNVLEAARLIVPESKIFLSGSGLQFVNNGVPITESDPFDATSMYAVSRIHTTYAARYFRSLGLKVYNGYFFNHDSPLRSEKHVAKRITEAVRRIFEGSGEKLEIGNIAVRKEWGYAGDSVNAVWKLVNQESIFEAIIGTGEAYSIKEWLELCFKQKGLNWEDHVTEIPGFLPEYSVLVSNPSLIKSLGWQPKVLFEDLSKMMLKF
jgi:GDPmannose 4,6-dehydratase